MFSPAVSSQSNNLLHSGSTLVGKMSNVLSTKCASVQRGVLRFGTVDLHFLSRVRWPDTGSCGARSSRATQKAFVNTLRRNVTELPQHVCVFGGGADGENFHLELANIKLVFF